MRLSSVLFFLLLSVSPLSQAEDIKVAFGNALAPWVMPETESGILVDLISETLGPEGYDVKNVYLPYARRILSYRQGLVDVVSDVNPKVIENEALDGFFF